MTSETMSRPAASSGREPAPIEVARIGPDRWKESYDLFMGALHLSPSTDERWAQVRGLYSPPRVYGAFEPGDTDGDMLGTIMTFELGLGLPGGTVAAATGGTFAGVRSGATRRGILGRMFRTRMDDMIEMGDVFMVVRPANADLWHRWGTGPTARTTTVRIDRLRSGPRAELAHRRGRARQLPPDTDLMAVLPAIQRRAAAGRPATVARPDAWWPAWSAYRHTSSQVHTAVGGPEDEPDGYVTWSVSYENEDLAQTRRVLRVIELHAGSRETATDLWLHLLHLELVEEIVAPGRPLDEQVPLLLANQRACAVGPVLDELWMRLIDVPAGLRARSWAPTADEAVVLEVLDDYVPRNAGCYRISSEGAEPVASGRPDLTCTVNQLSTLYHGDRTPSQLAGIGMIEVHEPAAVRRADRLFAVEAAPWGGTMF